MNDHSKHYNNFEEMHLAAQKLGEFQKIHNLLRTDFILLLNITDKHKSNEIEFDALYRA